MFATQLRDCPGLGVYFASYEFMARRMSKDGTMEALTSWQLLLAGGLFVLFSLATCLDVGRSDSQCT